MYTGIQALRAYRHIIRPLWQAQEMGAELDAEFDAGEWSGEAYHRKMEEIEARIKAYVCQRMGVSFEDLRTAYDESYVREMDEMFGPAERPTCSNQEMHAQFEERGIGDQCPHCFIRPGEFDHD